MLVNGQHYRTVWTDGSVVKLIDQTKLPFAFEIYECKTYRDTANAIKTMIVRGAPAIGATAAYALAQACLEFKGNDMTIPVVKEFDVTEKKQSIDLGDLFINK